MTYLTKNLAFFSNLDGMQAICAEKMFVEKLPQSRQLPFAVTTPLVKKGFLKSPQTFQKPKI